MTYKNETLILNVPELCYRDDFGKTPLHLAAAQDHLGSGLEIHPNQVQTSSVFTSVLVVAVLGTIVSNHGSMLNNVDQEGVSPSINSH